MTVVLKQWKGFSILRTIQIVITILSLWEVQISIILRQNNMILQTITMVQNEGLIFAYQRQSLSQCRVWKAYYTSQQAGRFKKFSMYIRGQLLLPVHTFSESIISQVYEMQQKKSSRTCMHRYICIYINNRPHHI